MAKIRFRDIDFKDDTIKIIAKMNKILAEYSGRVSVRQLYYRFVAADWIPNSQKSYDRIQNIITNARYAGMIDWDAIEDRNREASRPGEYRDGATALSGLIEGFRLNRWEGQPFYLECWCFPPKTPVTTPTGVVAIANLTVGDKVLDQNGTEQKISHVFRRHYKGNLIRIKACGLLPFETTPNHRILAAKADITRPGYTGSSRKYLKPEFVRADQLNKFDLLLVPRNKVVRDKQTIQLKGGPRTRNEPLIPIDELTCSVIGLFIAEGNIQTDERTTQFTFHRKEIKYAALVKAWADRAGFHWREIFGPGTRVVYVSGKAAALFFGDNCGRGSWNVHLPSWVMTLPHKKQLKIIEFYFRGDASLWDRTTSALVAGTRSPTLARQLQIILVRCGFSASICIITDHGEPRYNISIAGTHAEKIAATWSLPLPSRKRRFTYMPITDDYMLCPVRSTREVDYEGDVHNIEVETTNTYCVPCVVHNCEKAALAGVLSPISDTFHVTMMVNRGYSSASAMKESADRIRSRSGLTARPVVIYLGDHDPSGEDMVRDIRERLVEFGCPQWLDIRKLALTMAQIEEYKCPPNPAKVTDSRAAAYIEKFGDSSWELDALPPNALEDMLADAVASYIDKAKMDAVITRENQIKAALKKVAGTLPR